MFIQTEATPNPATLKFLPGREVIAGEPRDFRDPDTARLSPLASALFSLDGVTGVFLGSDFVSVTKSEAIEWAHIKPAILGAVMEHFMSGKPILAEGAANEPAVAGDGGDITFKGYKEGTVFLHMQGACSGCPSSTATLKSGIENLLRHFVPGVEQVQQI